MDSKVTKATDLTTLSDTLGSMYSQLDAMNLILNSVICELSDCIEEKCLNLGGSELLRNVLIWQLGMNSQISDIQSGITDVHQQYMDLMANPDMQVQEDPEMDMPMGGSYSEVSGASNKPSDYLVVEDKTKTTTWHLQVKRDGKPDHNLMGAAWAALHGGYRGNKYEGPKKQEALSKLKKLYKKEGLPLPSEK